MRDSPAEYTNPQSEIRTPQSNQFSGDFVGRVTPVPIPNTVVKPVGADDTAAFSCGKVGSRRINIEKARSEMNGFFLLR